MNNKYEVVLNNLLDGVLIVDRSGHIMYANNAAENLFSRNCERLNGMSLGFPIGEFEVQEIDVMKDGILHTMQMLVTSITWDEKEAFLLSFREITQLKEISRHLEKETQKLLQSNEELQQYAMLSSHDLKEPVRKILILTDRLIQKHEKISTEELRKQLGLIFFSAERMNMLLKGIADYSSVDQNSSAFQKVDLARVLNEVIADLDMMIKEKNAEIIIGDLPTIDAIKIQMHQLFLNIIQNALKYAKESTAPLIQLYAEDHGDSVKISIKDNGIGFDNNFSKSVFRPFMRLSRERNDGSGIGLAICKKIVDVHSGEISVDSRKGKGSDFMILLPKKRTA